MRALFYNFWSKACSTVTLWNKLNRWDNYSVSVDTARFEKNTVYFQNALQSPMMTPFERSELMIKLVSLATQRELASRCCVSLGTEYRIISKYLKAKLRRRCRVHRLSEAQIFKKCIRSWRLYLRLNFGKWKNVITTDETMFYMGFRRGQMKRF